MANGLEMLYNAIGGAGSSLSGHLRETELNRIAAEAAARDQAERDAFALEAQKALDDQNLQAAEYARKAQELGIDVPAPGSIDAQIFQATGGLGMRPLSVPAVGGGTQLPVSSPNTEWAPSAAEAAITADSLRAGKDLLSGRPALNPDIYRKRLELIEGLKLRAASRPSTKGMVDALNDQSRNFSDFMTREGTIRDEGRKLQGTLSGRFFENRAQSARDRQSDAFREQNANQRAREQNALQERIAKDKNDLEAKKEARMEDKELRLQQAQLIAAGKLGEAQKAKMLADVKALQSGDLSKEAFLLAYPNAKVEKTFFGGTNVVGLDLQEAQQSVNRALVLLPQYQDELARRVGPPTPGAQNPAIQPIRSSGLGGNMYPAVTPAGGALPNLNNPSKPRVF